jgi:ribonuclease Y
LITEILFGIIGIVLGSLAGIRVGILIRKNISEKQIGSAEIESKRIVDESRKEAETRKKEILIEAKDETHKLRNELERETRERRAELQKTEKRLFKKEETLDSKSLNIEKKEDSLQRKIKEVEFKQLRLTAIHEKQNEELERISGLTTEEAKEILINNIKKEAEQEAALVVKEIEKDAKENAERKAREIITYAVQKCSADHVAETTVSVVDLPNDEMKGRIIGREGRNIRALETLTGIDLIIDDTPEAVVISGFDPIRREVAKLALEKLIADGRIHPARIEEMVEKAKKEIDQKIKDDGEQAAFETGVHGLHPELIKLLGRLRFRTSYGQNVLKHSVEVAHLAGIMAAELGADVKIAKRAGLLHDIGKAVDHEIEGSHVSIGEDLARKYKESKAIVHGIAAHHNDIEPQSVEAVLVQAADAISASRPGARRETLESYIKRLEKLEEISNSFEGVEKSFAIQAGREIRIMVKPEVVNDNSIILIAKEIVKKIEDELEYPGQIKVNVIRETRAIEYAK